MRALLFLTLICIFANGVVSIASDYQGTFPFHECNVRSEKDGGEYYESIYEALMTAKHEVLIAGWKIIPESPIHNRGSLNNVTLLEAVLQAKSRGVKIHILYWTNEMLYFWGRDWMGMHLPEGLEHWRKNNISVLVDDGRSWLINLRWSQHQKFVVADRTYAFVGGIDIANARYDTQLHVFNDSRRFEHSDEVGKWDEIRQYRPWHDWGVRVQGDSVKEIADNFITRWQTYCKQFWVRTPAGCKAADMPSKDISFQIAPLPAENATDYCMTTRACAPWSCGSKVIETDIYKSIQWMIKNAEHYLYFENQYVISQPFSRNDLSQLIVEKVKSKILAMEKFKVYIVFPIACEERRLAMASKLTTKFRKTSITDSIHKFIEEVKKDKSKSEEFKQFISKVQLEDYLRFDFIATTAFNKTENWLGWRQIFLHSKIVIADDKWASVGSANWNDRSYFGDRDSELNVFVKPKTQHEGLMNGQKVMKGHYAKLLRLELMREHLGLPQTGSIEDPILEDPTADSFYYGYWNRVAMSNLNITKEIFGINPEELDIQNDWDQIMDKTTKVVYTEENYEKLTKFQGHLVHYPKNTWGKNSNIFFTYLEYIPFINTALMYKLPEEVAQTQN